MICATFFAEPSWLFGNLEEGTSRILGLVRIGQKSFQRTLLFVLLDDNGFDASDELFHFRLVLMLRISMVVFEMVSPILLFVP